MHDRDQILKWKYVMRLFSAFVLLLLMNLGPLAAHADEMIQREAIRKAVVSAFINGRFDQLDAMASQFRNGRERTESGVWKLTVFYSSFSAATLDPNYNATSMDRVEAQTQAWMKARPNSITAQLGYAALLWSHAWFLRGGAYFSQLTDEQRTGYVKYLAKEHDHLIAIKDKASVDPEWYTLMVLVAKEEGWPDEAFDSLLTEAVNREPYYYQTYFSAIERNLPQWGGSADKINALIARATNYTRPIDGNSFTARAHWFVSVYGEDIVRSLNAKWPDIDRGFQDLVRRYPDQLNFNAYAKFACLAKDRATFLTAYGQLKDKLMVEGWDDPGQGMVCAVWAMRPERNIQIE